MEQAELVSMLDQIIKDRGVPRNIRETLEESIQILNGSESMSEKVSYIISLLDDASNDTNLSSYTRINIWNLISTLENFKTDI
ncbi:MAG: UPF0147 family protein [Candidatus Aenigmatarchaeota archaeon]